MSPIATAKHEEIKQYWSQRARRYGASGSATLAEGHLRRLEIRTIMQYLRRLQPKTVLDVGCGNGFSTKQYACKFSNISFVGLDYCPDMIAAAQQSLLPNCRFVRGDVLDPDSLPEGHFDMVLTQRCLQNLADYESQARAIRNLLAKKSEHGTLLLMECSKDGVRQLNHLRRALGKKTIEGIEPWHNNFFVDQRLVDDFQAEPDYFSSTYMFLTKVIHPKLGRWAQFLPAWGRFGYDRLYIIRKGRGAGLRED